ncbi:MAG TPA: nucleotide sugar dehydrogenase [Solirubrobacteraceae bacterium]|nr:nucleotide sugar dehydrogenase [Solirubrobacteraceae bacterium]
MTIGIVGLGYVGLPLAVEFAEAGQRVVGIDTNQARVNQLRAGESYIEDIPTERLQAVASRIEATTRTSRLAQCDAIIVAVPTPLTANREPDLAPLISAAQAVADALQPGQLVILESTTYPGTTRERVLPILEETGLVAGRDFHLAFSPERVDPGNETYSLHNTPKILGGLTPACRNRAEAVYGLVCEQIVPVSTLEVSEMAKLLENIFRSVNIALVNELARLADRMHIDIHEVIDAAATKPFGFMRFDPGPGMGGHCLPVDPFYLSWKARELDFATEFIELAGKVNQTQPYFCVEQAERALNEQGKAVNGSKIAVLGVAYKPGVGDIRESPALKIIDRLQALGADVSYHDSYVPELTQFGLQNTDLEQALAGADVALIVTAHPGIDHNSIAASVPTVDFRGVTRTERAVARPPAELPVPRAEQNQPMEVAA